MHALNGRCHCGNLSLALGLPKPLPHYHPRACDCAFCRKHGARYLADPAGSLRIRVRDAAELVIYHQGSGIAECLICGRCGVLVAITYRDGDRLYAVANASVLDDAETLGDSLPVSPRTLSADEKIARWKQLWFSDVRLEAASASTGRRTP
jgi:hypothetical protein